MNPWPVDFTHKTTTMAAHKNDHASNVWAKINRYPEVSFINV